MIKYIHTCTYINVTHVLVLNARTHDRIELASTKLFASTELFEELMANGASALIDGNLD